MRCFVAGANGFIGRHVVRALLRAGWTVVGGARDAVQAERLTPDIEWLAVEFNRDTDAETWRLRLVGFDALVNCVGVFQSGRFDDSRRIHVEATAAMFRGAAAAGVRRAVHISALGADPAGATVFARDKAAGDAALLAIDMDTLVLRPSLVYARDTYGGTRAMRALAGLPGIVPILAGPIAFDPIHADDLGDIVARCLGPGVPARRIYDVGGPERLTLRQIVQAMRAWLGFPPAQFFTVPGAVLQPLLRLGDLFGWFGARPAFRSTLLTQALATPLADGAAIIAATGVQPRAMRAAMAAEPAAAEDRLAARLGLVLPALRIVLGVFWIVSGIVTLLPSPFAAARSIAEAAGVSESLSAVVVAAAAVVDIALGIPMLIGLNVRSFALLQGRSPCSMLRCSEFLSRRFGPIRWGRWSRRCRSFSLRWWSPRQPRSGDVLYLALKYVHIIGATILFGTGLGIAFFLFVAMRSRDVAAIAATLKIVVLADFVFTAPAVAVQLTSGIALAEVLGIPFTQPWIAGALALYVLVGLCWLPVVAIQIRMLRLAEKARGEGGPLPEPFRHLYRAWFVLGWPAFAGVLGILVLMVWKPG